MAYNKAKKDGDSKIKLKELKASILEQNGIIPGQLCSDMFHRIQFLGGEEGKEQIINDLGDVLANRLHEDWRKTRQKEDGTFEPRIKKTTDKEWIAKNGRYEVDIANNFYANLPNDWKKIKKQEEWQLAFMRMD